MQILIWNLYHGRAVPPAGRDLFDDFAAALDGWEWDVALLQEVPPWWPADLPGVWQATVRTSRNFPLPVRKALARRWPDTMKSNGGGANAILVRSRRLGRADQQATRLLRHYPERRLVHGVRVGGTWFANLHASANDPARARKDVELAAHSVTRWAGDAPAILGGDFNLRDPVLPGYLHIAERDVDHVFTLGGQASGFEVLERGTLSDHPPLRVHMSFSRHPS